MFEAQIEEHALFSGARADPHRNREPRHNLQPIREVVRPPDARIQKESLRPGRPARRSHRLCVQIVGLEHDVEARVRQPYETLSGVVAPRRRSVASTVVRMGTRVAPAFQWVTSIG